MTRTHLAIPLSLTLLGPVSGCFNESDPLSADDTGDSAADDTDGGDDPSAGSAGGTSGDDSGGTTGEDPDTTAGDGSGGSTSDGGGTTGDDSDGGTTGDGTTGDDSGGGTTGGGTTGDGTTGDDSGGTTGDPGTTGAGGSTGGSMPDGVPPEVLSVSPEVSALGVAKESNIVLTFSEPMDEASVEAAWSGALAGIKTASVTFGWNVDSTVLTIDPNDDLIYAEGPPGTMATYYTYALDLGVMDQSGELMEAEFLGSFSTLRRIKDHIYSVAKLTGTITLDGQSVLANPDACYVGDDFMDRPMLCGVSFDLTGLDGEPTTLEVASIDWALAGSGYAGQPLEQLGGIQRWAIEYDELETMEAGKLEDPNANLGMVYEAYAPMTTATDEVTAVTAELDGGDGMLQYRLQIDGPWAVVDGGSDYWKLQSANYPNLELQYLTP